MEYTLKSGNVEINKIKAIRPQIIVTGTVEKPYYEILYYDISDKTWHIGYSSYNLANVIKWKEECFEVVGEIEDMQPTADVVEVVRCKDCKCCEQCYPAKAIGEEAIVSWYCKIRNKHMQPDDFCSYGERRDT